MKRSEQINELATAMAKAQGEMENASEDGENTHFESSYATLASVRNVCRGPLSKNGLALMQFPSTTAEGYMRLTSILTHTSGQWIEDELVMVPRDKSPQAFGSCESYARRYSTMGITGIASKEDDDGNAASLPPRQASPVRPNSPVATATKGSPDKRPAIIPVPSSGANPGNPDERHPSSAQLKRFFAIANSGGWDESSLKNYLNLAYGIDSTSKLTLAQYNALCGGDAGPGVLAMGPEAAIQGVNQSSLHEPAPGEFGWEPGSSG